MQFQEIILLPSHIKISVRSMSFTGNASPFEKLQKKNKNSECSGNDLSANLASASCSQVAIFPLDGNARIPENCIAIVSEILFLLAAAESCNENKTIRRRSSKNILVVSIALVIVLGHLFNKRNDF